jgi:flagellar protein FliT
MTANEVLCMYETIAGLSNQMALAARLSDWDGLSKLERQCAFEAGAISAGPMTPLSGAPRLRKIDLIKNILANDREIRNMTEPWMTQLSKVMQAPHQS